MLVDMVKQFGIDPDPQKRIRRRQGKAIRETREMLGMSPTELAESVGVTPGAISQWENGRTSPRQHHQIAVAQTLNVPWSLLFGLDGEVA